MFKVITTESFEKEFGRVKERALQGDIESAQLVKLIERGIEKLKYSYRYGRHISVNKIPKEYVEKYGVKNLWKLNLGAVWRLIYTIRGTEIEVISVLLEFLDHKTYDRKFKYRGN